MIKYITYLIAKARIPKGGYCVEYTKMYHPKFGFFIKVKTCPYHNVDIMIDDVEYCELCKKPLFSEDKICGINDD